MQEVRESNKQAMAAAGGSAAAAAAGGGEADWQIRTGCLLCTARAEHNKSSSSCSAVGEARVVASICRIDSIYDVRRCDHS